jgi:hypothetical protein
VAPPFSEEASASATLRKAYVRGEQAASTARIANQAGRKVAASDMERRRDVNR